MQVAMLQRRDDDHGPRKPRAAVDEPSCERVRNGRSWRPGAVVAFRPRRLFAPAPWPLVPYRLLVAGMSEPSGSLMMTLLSVAFAAFWISLIVIAARG
jgi:hypothetical protein